MWAEVALLADGRARDGALFGREVVPAIRAVHVVRRRGVGKVPDARGLAPRRAAHDIVVVRAVGEGRVDPKAKHCEVLAQASRQCDAHHTRGRPARQVVFAHGARYQSRRESGYTVREGARPARVAVAHQAVEDRRRSRFGEAGVGRHRQRRSCADVLREHRAERVAIRAYHDGVAVDARPLFVFQQRARAPDDRARRKVEPSDVRKVEGGPEVAVAGRVHPGVNLKRMVLESLVHPFQEAVRFFFRLPTRALPRGHDAL